MYDDFDVYDSFVDDFDDQFDELDDQVDEINEMYEMEMDSLQDEIEQLEFDLELAEMERDNMLRDIASENNYNPPRKSSFVSNVITAAAIVHFLKKLF